MASKKCYHCGTDCDATPIIFDDKAFCCNGCKTVYEILNQNELSCYYDLEQAPGSIPGEIRGKFDYLDNEAIASKLLEFDDLSTAVVNFYVPTIHCSSCIWVLENLHKLNHGVKAALVNFPKKEVRITYRKTEVSLKEVAELISSIGYEPYISLEDDNSPRKGIDRKLIYQVAVAGFAFGNIMMLSFPEYFQMDEFWLNRFKPFFRGLMFTFSIPAVVYSARDYFLSAYKGLSKGILNIDVPISLGILVLFIRSTYEILSGTGPGYFDSLTGLIFFLLLGKVFQQKTYGFLSFERDYKSYFPIAVTRIDKDRKEENVSVHDIQKGDRLLIRNQEILPVDGIMLNGAGLIDYSFVTGESIPVLKTSGDKLYAGGRQTGRAIEMEAMESVNQSYLTQLWSNEVFHENEAKNIKTLTDSISKQFTLIVLGIALIAGTFWFFKDKRMAFQVVSAILIVACPCALALSAPFALGNMLRIFGRNRFYLKHTVVIEALARANALVFDKTGTLTANDATDIAYIGEKLSRTEKDCIRSLLRSSNHPLSRMLYEHLGKGGSREPVDYTEVLGKGLKGLFHEDLLLLGSADFVGAKAPEQPETAIYLKWNARIKGRFVFRNSYRTALGDTLSELGERFDLSVLSGDNEGERETLESLLPRDSAIHFRQQPEDKLHYIKNAQEQGKNIIMFGDGLNDAGALAQSNVGVAVSENINVFSPACDAILDARSFHRIPEFIRLSHKTMYVIKVSFVISFLYNIIGMLFAVSGNLSPVIAAILMPISSISVVLFATISTNLFAKKILY